MHLINIKIIKFVLIALVLFGPMTISIGHCDGKSVQNNGLPQERGNKIPDLGPPVDAPGHGPTVNGLVDETIVNGKETNETSTNEAVTKGKLANEKPKSKSKDFYDKVPDLIDYTSEPEILYSGTKVNEPSYFFITLICLINLSAFNLVI